MLLVVFDFRQRFWIGYGKRVVVDRESDIPTAIEAVAGRDASFEIVEQREIVGDELERYRDRERRIKSWIELAARGEARRGLL